MRRRPALLGGCSCSAPVGAFSLSYSDVPVGTETSCPTSISAQITPPGNYQSATLPLQMDPCGGGTVHVSPVYPLAG